MTGLWVPEWWGQHEQQMARLLQAPRARVQLWGVPEALFVQEPRVLGSSCGCRVGNTGARKGESCGAAEEAETSRASQWQHQDLRL